MCGTRLVQCVSVLSAGFGLFGGQKAAVAPGGPSFHGAPPYTLHTTYIGTGVSVVELWGRGA